MILDQTNDTSDTNGIYICDTNIELRVEGTGGGNNEWPEPSAVLPHSQQQVTKVTGVTSTGGSSYNVTITPGLFFSNVRSAKLRAHGGRVRFGTMALKA